MDYILLSLFLGIVLILKQIDNSKLQNLLSKLRFPVILGITILLVYSVSMVFSCPIEWLELFALNTFFDTIFLISLFVAYNHSWEYWTSLNRIVHLFCTILGAVKIGSILGLILLVLYNYIKYA